MAKKLNTDELTEMFKFLDDLRSGGQTNMYGAGPFLRDEFGLSKAESHQALDLWMKTFGAYETAAVRADAAIATTNRLKP